MSLALKWALVLSLFAILLGSSVVFGMRFYAQVAQLPPFDPKSRLSSPPANATTLPPPTSLMFDISLSSNKVALSRGESENITITIHGEAEVNVSLAVEMTDPSMPLLPAGISVVFEKNTLTVHTNSTVTVNLIVSIQHEAVPGEYELDVVGTQRVGGWALSMGLPLKVIVS